MVELRLAVNNHSGCGATDGGTDAAMPPLHAGCGVAHLRHARVAEAQAVTPLPLSLLLLLPLQPFPCLVAAHASLGSDTASLFLTSHHSAKARRIALSPLPLSNNVPRRPSPCHAVPRRPAPCHAVPRRALNSGDDFDVEGVEVTPKAVSGYVYKTGQRSKAWKKRWYVLDIGTQTLAYFDGPKSKKANGDVEGVSGSVAPAPTLGSSLASRLRATLCLSKPSGGGWQEQQPLLKNTMHHNRYYT